MDKLNLPNGGIVTLANHGDLFCISYGRGYSCLGFDVARDRTERLANWLNRPELRPTAARGTLESYAEYTAAMDAARVQCEKTGGRCPVELTPQLNGLEGKRVEVTDSDGNTRRFQVGKSTGWLPCHLELANRRSSGGTAVYGAPFRTVRVVS